MYGCDNFCTYCIVPYVRGRERSRSPENIIAEVRQVVNDGYIEVTLLGQNVNSYNYDGVRFPELLKRVNDEVRGLKRLRFMTSHPRTSRMNSSMQWRRLTKYASIFICRYSPEATEFSDL